MVDSAHTNGHAQLSPSSLAFLYAHKFAPAAKPGTTGTLSLANDSVVETAALGRMLVNLALWSLQDAGAVALEPFKEKRMRFIPWSGVRVRLVEPVAMGGIEGDVIDKLARDKKGREPGMDISLLVNLLYRDAKHPEALVRKRVVDEVVSLGYASRESTDVSRVKHAVTGQSRAELVADAAKIEPLAGAAKDLVERWNGFFDGQPDLRTELITAVREAFRILVRDRSDD